jgi:hypothetical protein
VQACCLRLRPLDRLRFLFLLRSFQVEDDAIVPRPAEDNIQTMSLRSPLQSVSNGRLVVIAA